MPRIQAINPEAAEGKTKVILDGIQKKLGMTPNLIRTLANSNATLNAYLAISGALAQSSLPATLREQIALTVSEINGCNYCLAAHSAIGKSVGLSDEKILDSRSGTSTDSREESAIKFARAIVEKKGWVSDEDLSSVRNAGYTEGEVTEILTTVIFMIFTNYFNHVADTEIDFPEVPQLATV